MSRMPPVPPASRSNKGPGGAPTVSRDTGPDKRHVPENVDREGQQGSVKQNTTNQGYQQDR